PLRAVIDIDASKEDMETANIKGQEVFIQICCSFIRVLYQILDCGWKDILKGLEIATSSDSSKYSYHILYAPALLINHHELKAFTELVYTLTGEKFGKYIDRGLPGQNFNLRLIGSAKKPPTSLGVKKHSNYLRDWTIEEKEEMKENFIYFNWKALLECPQCKCIYDKDQRDESREVFECDPSIAEKIQKENKNLSHASHRIKGLGFPKAFVKMPSWVKYNENLTATEIYEERYVRPLPNEDDIYVGSPWETGKTYVLEHLTISDDVNLLVLSTRHSYSNAVTTRLNLKSYCDID
ncbi:17367_t:CDS:2, partial [Funneliformis geosporum]